MFIRSQRFLSNNTHSSLLPVLKRKGSYLILALFSVVFFIFFTPLVQAAQCSAVFTDGLQNNKNGGEIAFKNGSQLKNSPNNILDSKKNIDDGSGNNVNSCDSGNCINSGSKAERVNYNNFPNGNDVEVSYQQTISLAPGGYNEFKVASEATVKLSAGDYTFKDDFILGSSSKIEIVGTGVVRIFVKNKVTTNNKAKINLNGNATKLLLYARDDIEIGAESEISAFIYSDKKVSLKNKAFVEGAISAGNDVDLISASTVSFVNIEPDFGGFCGSESLPVPILDYRFDDCSYTGSTNEVFDQQEDFHGNAIGVPDPIADAVVNQSMDLSANGISDWVQVPNDAIDGLNDFTIAVWIKTSVSKSQQEIFHALGGSTGDDELEIYLIDADEVRVKVRDEGDELELNNGVNLTDGNWHHLVITRKGEDVCLFVDGEEQECDDGVNNGALDVPELNAIVIGQEQDAYGGGFNASQSFEGKLDEFKIYDTKLTSTNIKTIYDNELAGKNYDGTVRTVPQCNSLIANFRFDESSWSGAPGEVIDTAGNFNAQANNGANTARSNPARIGNPGTCGYGVFDGVDDFVQIADNDALDLPNELTISAWIYPQSLPSSGLMSILSKDENYEFHLTPSGEVNWWWSTNSFSTSGAAIRANNWYHIAITYKNGQQRIYVDGEILASQAYTGQLAVNNDPLQIGQDQGFNGRYFHGAIDEVQLYKQALSNAQVNDIYLERHACDSFIDHFEIDVLDGQGLTCEADNIIIKACADASCNTINPDAVDVNLSINGTAYKLVTISGNNGTTTSYPFTTVGNVALSLDQSYECKNTPGVASCNVDFKDSGFIFSPIPTQISGKPSDKGFNATTLSLRAVETDTNTGACIGTFPDGADVAVNLSYSCAGGDCKDLLALSNKGNNYTLTETPTENDLHFSADSTAFFTLKYPHAGKFVINAQKDVEVEDSDGNKEIKDFNVSSNAFVERPFAFKIDFSQDVNHSNAFAQNTAGAADASQGPFKKAGEIFKLTATAVQWQDGQDGSPYDGIPDDFSAINNNLTAENFSDGRLTIIDELVLPKVSDGANPGVLYTQQNNSFINSIITNEYHYSEVGILKLNVNLLDNDYLGAGDIFGGVNNVGRFTPAYFTQSVLSKGELNAYHYESICEINNWAYAGQKRVRDNNEVGAISYSDNLEPMINITAYNLNGVITENYTELGFMNLVKSGVDITAPVNDDEALRVEPVTLGEKIILSSVMSLGDDPVPSDVEGIVTYTFNPLDHFIYEHTKHSKVAPFPAKIPFLITRVEDQDNINLYNGSDASIISTVKVVTAGVDIRFGRWLLENSYGPETSPLPVTMLTQIFDGTTFINNELENCQVPELGELELTGDIGDGGMDLWHYRLVDIDTLDSLLPSDTEPSVEDKSFVSGLYQSLFFSASGVGLQGSLKFEYQVPLWQQYDWNNDGSFTNNPTTTLTFGMYRGNDRIIYQREIEKSN